MNRLEVREVWSQGITLYNMHCRDILIGARLEEKTRLPHVRFIEFLKVEVSKILSVGQVFEIMFISPIDKCPLRSCKIMFKL